MAPPVVVDVWIHGLLDSTRDNPDRRAELLTRVAALHPVSKVDEAQFVVGGRLRLRRGVDEAEGARLVAELQVLGLRAAAEADRGAGDDEMLALDQLGGIDGGDAARAVAVDEEAMGRLTSLDGDEPAPASVAPSIVASSSVAPVSVAPASADDDARFRPKQEVGLPTELEVERPVVLTPPPEAFTQVPEPASDEPAAPVDEWKPVPGRIAQGALRKKPALRIGVGVVLALALGWMLAQPYARRAERHVAELRADADRERYRPVDEAQRRTAALDAEVDAASSSAAFGTAAVWLVIAAALFAGWWRAT